jgi:predicted nucleotidyltransferase
MNFGEAFGGIVPGARGAVLGALLRTGTPLTGRQTHTLVGDRHSLGSVQQALRDLEHLGLIRTETVGRAGLHRVNERHEAIGPLRSLTSPLDMLVEVVRDVATGAQAVIVFGSVARGEAHADSDVDLAVIAPPRWSRRIELEDAVRERLGSDCDVVHLTLGDFTSETREPVVDEILRDGMALLGELPRPNLRTAQ